MIFYVIGPCLGVHARPGTSWNLCNAILMRCPEHTERTGIDRGVGVADLKTSQLDPYLTRARSVGAL